MTDLNKYQDELSKCSKCGFCQAFCPVYAVTGIETMTARGRNAQLIGVIEGKLSLPETEEALSSCLLCKACVPSCFSGVKTDEMVRAGREAMVEAKGVGALKRFIFNNILPYPNRIAVFLSIAFFLKKTGLIGMAKRTGMVPEAMRTADDLMEGIPEGSLHPGTPTTSSPGKAVVYFKSCGFNYLLPEVGKATIKVIERLGYGVAIPDNSCCGMPPYAYGDTEAAKVLAKKNIRALEGFETILTDCGSCSSFLKKYSELLSDNPEYAERANRLSGRVQDTNEFIFKEKMKIIPHSAFHIPKPLKVTYHDPCHLSRYQGITIEPREIISSIPGVEFIELHEADWCCGGAGSYSIVNREVSMNILDRKIGNVKNTGADILVTSCPACIIHLSYGVRRAGLKVRVVHVNQLLAESHL